MEILPIDAHIDALLKIETPNFVLRATAGSGKTTRVPIAFAKQNKGIVLCVEPRRLAAVSAANRVAVELGEKVGDSVGYHVRMDKRIGKATKLLFVTTGMLLQYLCQDPLLEQVSAVIFDEFHERALEMDTALAMIRYVQREFRENCRIIIMSATLDPAPIENFLSPCSVYDVEAPRYPLQIEYIATPSGGWFRDYRASLVEALQRASRNDQGDILVFLPGMADILAAKEEAQNLFGQQFDLVVCHASLPIEEQTAVLRPTTAKRRIVFSTNVAESSVTIPRITCVIDTGLAKEKFFDSAIGLSRLETVRISRASADQRAGRAARVAPGVCIRLWEQNRHALLEAETHPQIDHLDLAQSVLQIYAWGLVSHQALAFLTPPRAGRLSDACQVLLRLGALKDEGNDAPYTLSEMGRMMVRLPLEPRLARWMMAAREYGCEKDTALLAAVEQLEVQIFPDPWSLQSICSAVCNLHTRLYAALTEHDELMGYLFVTQVMDTADIAYQKIDYLA